MFLFGKSKLYYNIAQSVVGLLAESAQPDLKEIFLKQKALIKNVTIGSDKSGLTLQVHFKHFPKYNELMDIESNYISDRVFASLALRNNGQKFFADVYVRSTGEISTILFTWFPESAEFELEHVDFFLKYLQTKTKDALNLEPFRISPKLVALLGADYDRLYTPFLFDEDDDETDDVEDKGGLYDSPFHDDDDDDVEDDSEEEDDDEPEFRPALKSELREEFQRSIHAALPGEMQEFCKYFSTLYWHTTMLYGYSDDMQLIPMGKGKYGMYVVATVQGSEYGADELYVLVSSDPERKGRLYYLSCHDNLEEDCIVPIKTDIFSFILKWEKEHVR